MQIGLRRVLYSKKERMSQMRWNFEQISQFQLFLEEITHSTVELRTNDVSRCWWVNDDTGVDIYLRFYPQNGLTLARFQVPQSRQGMGTTIMTRLESEIKKLDGGTLWIENALTPSMIEFCKARGFKADYDQGWMIDDTFYGNWKKEISAPQH